MAFTQWTIRLTKYFFGPEFAHRQVRLMLTRSILDEAFVDLGGTAGFLRAVRTGPTWYRPDPGTLHGRAMDLHQFWTHPNWRPLGYPAKLASLKDVPPYLPYLSLLCLAWTEGEDQVAAGHGFYPRLNPLYPDHGMNALLLAHWDPLWVGLQKWTQSLHEKWGQFIVERLGGMVHVGIPKSQVILTPTKIERLPELFWRCHLPAGVTTFDPETLRQALCAKEAESLQVLGYSLFDEISGNTDLGKSACRIITEYLEDWDGQPPIGFDGPPAPGAPAQRGRYELRLVLSPDPDAELWHVAFGMVEQDDAVAIKVPSKGWQLTNYEANLHVLDHIPGKPVDACEFASRWGTGLEFEAQASEDVAGDRGLSLRLSPATLRIFGWMGSHLVELLDLPTMGSVFLLISPSAEQEWTEWSDRFGKHLSIQDYTRKGLPHGFKLLYADNLHALDDPARQAFPSDNVGPKNRVRIVRFIGGSRANRVASRRLYARYDPPKLAVEASADLRVEVFGAENTPLHRVATPSHLPGNETRLYSLRIPADSSLVVARAYLNGDEVAHASFGVWQDSGGEESTTDTHQIFLDQFAQPAAGAGASGVITPVPDLTWTFPSGPFVPGKPFTDDLFEASPFLFLESLALGNARFPYQEYKRRAHEITKLDLGLLSRETRWLTDLAFAELESDTRGRWAYIRPLPLALYPLPFKSKSRYQAAVCGCAPRSRIRRLVALARDCGCAVECTATASTLAPPRITLLHDDLSTFELIGEELKVIWTPTPPALQLATWSGSLSAWLELLHKKGSFYEGFGPTPTREYWPESFATVDGSDHHHAPYRLCSMEDTQTQRHWWHTLVHKSSCHTFVRDPCPAKWEVQRAATDSDWRESLGFPYSEATFIPYDEPTASLTLPRGLGLPHLLARAASLSSGLPAQLGSACTAFSSARYGFLPNEDADTYSGPCWVYPCIPMEIAKTLLSKLSAEPLSTPHAFPPHLRIHTL